MPEQKPMTEDEQRALEIVEKGDTYVSPATTLANVERRQQLIARVRHARQEIEQSFIDVAHWNAHHPNEAPIDNDPDGLLRKIADHYDRILKPETH